MSDDPDRVELLKKVRERLDKQVAAVISNAPAPDTIERFQADLALCLRSQVRGILSKFPRDETFRQDDAAKWWMRAREVSVLSDGTIPRPPEPPEGIATEPEYLSYLDSLDAWAREATGCGQPNSKPAPTPNGTQQSEGGKPPADASNDAPVGPAKRPIPRAEAERLVATAAANTPPDQRHKLTVRALNRATGVSVGMIPTLKAWKNLQDEKPGSVRSVPLTDAILAVLNDPSADAADPAEAAADAEVLGELLALAATDAERKRFETITPGERWQMLELLKEQTDDARRDQRRPRRERPGRS